MPQWTYTIRLGDVWRNPTMTFEERRDKIVARLQASRWLREADSCVIHNLVEELGGAPDADEFDAVWDVIYDEANADRAWIDTTSRAA